jgi:hypothetical protein
VIFSRAVSCTSTPNSNDSSAPKLPSICLLAGYFGKLPDYFACFLRSCELNPSIQWIILTDDDSANWNQPQNLHIKQTTLAELQALFSRRLGINVELNRAYVLCDFRPAFGLLFDDLFAGFDFWGHCDLDMINGDLRRFLTNDILAKHDRVLQRGAMSLYRNTEEMNHAFMRPAPGAMDYRTVFRDPHYLGFDEWRGIYRILRYHGVPQYREEIVADIVAPTRWKIPRFEATELRNHPLQFFYWLRGKVFQGYYNNELGIEDHEVAYIHFQKRRLPAPSFDARHAEGFLITPDGFRPYQGEHLSPTEVEGMNRARWRPFKDIFADYLVGAKRRLQRYLAILI